jgi:4-hydroxy-tetrahydrodipicolinate synthase
MNDEASSRGTQAMARFGLSAAIATPFDAAFEPDCARLAAHARALIEAGCGGVTLFGTTGEGAALSLAQRRAMLEATVAAVGEPRRRVTVGVTACALDDARDQARLGLDADCRALMVTPPFYFKGVDDEALFVWHARLFDRLGARARDVILYHIPGVTQVAISPELVGRLKTAFPGVVIGVKDSSGDWANSARLVAEHADLIILIGDERHLARGVRAGGSGAISGLANIFPAELTQMIVNGADDARISGLVDDLVRLPVIPAVKALIALARGDSAWRRCAPPLADLTDAQMATAARMLDACRGAKAA